MKKRIGNDITFTWHIYRKSGESQTPESFDGKDVEVKLISPLKQPVTIEDVSIATGVVTFTFRGKHQVTLGNYVAILQENRGENGMVTLDVVSAVTLVAHSYMEEDGDDGDVIEASSVELESSIIAGGIVQLQADWAQTDDTAVDFIKNKPNLDVYCRKDANNTHSDGVSDTFVKKGYYEQGGLLQFDRLTVSGDSIKFYHSHRGKEPKELLLQLDDVEKIKRTATAELDGLMSAEDKDKLNALPTATELTQELESKANSADLAEVATSGSYNDLSDKPTLDDLNKDSELYALDNSNADYIAAVNALITQGTEIPISHDIEGAKLRVYKKTYGGTETGTKTTTLIKSPVSELPYADGTTFVAYQRGNYRYIGLKTNFFDNVSESYTNGNIEVTCEVAGILKLYFFDCDMREDAYFKKNGQTTNVKLKNGVLSFDVEAGDVLTVSPTYSNGYQWVGLVGMSITGKYPVSKFINDAGYVAKSVDNLVNYYLKSETYTKAEVQLLIGAIQQFHYEVYPTLPQTGASNVLYLIGPTGTGADKYEEYVYANNDWAKIGDTSIDLSGYVTTEALTTALADYVTSSALSTALAGKADKSEMSVVPGTGANADKTTITLKQGTSATVLTAHQDISGKENVMPITTATGATLSAVVGNYYRLDNVGTLAITLPTITGATKLQAITFLLACGSSALVTFAPQGSETILYQEDFALEADTTYEVTALWNGSEWTLSRVIYA